MLAIVSILNLLGRRLGHYDAIGNIIFGIASRYLQCTCIEYRFIRFLFEHFFTILFEAVYDLLMCFNKCFKEPNIVCFPRLISIISVVRNLVVKVC